MVKYIEKSKVEAMLWAVILDKTEQTIEEMLDNAPTADVKPVTHSHWVHNKGEHHEYVSCARCGELAKCTEMADCFIWKYSKYCSDCGSRMDGEIEEVEE